jgi:MraZ protein
MSSYFNGSYTAKIDEKNRVVLPQSLRYGLVENGKLAFTVCLGLGGCLCIYTPLQMEKIVSRFRKWQHVAKYQKFFTLFFSTLHNTTCDKIGRFMIPPMLKKVAQIKDQIVFAGVMEKIEVWPKDKYEFELMSFEELPAIMEEAFGNLQAEEVVDSEEVLI